MDHLRRRIGFFCAHPSSKACLVALLIDMRLVLAHKILYGSPEQRELAVKEMFCLGKNFEFRTRLKLIDPGNSFVNINQFVLVTLQNEPRTIRLDLKITGEAGHGRSNTDEPGRFADHGSTNRHRCTERKPRQPDRQIRQFVSHPVNRSQDIVNLTVAIIKVAVTITCSAKIEPERRVSNAKETPGERMCNLVLHRTAMHRVWVTHHGATRRWRILRRLNDRLKLSRRPG